jgi:hypothetical protein
MPSFLRFSQTDDAWTFDDANDRVIIDLAKLVSKNDPPNFTPINQALLPPDPFVEPILYQLILHYQDHQSKREDASLVIGAPVQGDLDRRWQLSMGSIMQNGVQTPVKYATATIQLMEFAKRTPNPIDLI